MWMARLRPPKKKKKKKSKEAKTRQNKTKKNKLGSADNPPIPQNIYMQ